MAQLVIGLVALRW